MTAIQCQPQRTVRFYGPLAKVLGRRSFSAIGLNSASEVMRCLLSNFPQIGSHMRGRHYRVVMNGRAISKDELNDPVGDNHEIHIIPAICGAGGGGPLTSILAGVALIGAGLLFPFASSFLTPLGIGLVLQGVAELISPTPNVEPKSTDPSNQSYNFSNIQQTSREGVPVPLVYGEIVTGSVVLSVNIERDDEKIEQVFEEGLGDPNPNQNPVPDPPSNEETFEEFFARMQVEYPGIIWQYRGQAYLEPNPGCPAAAYPNGTLREENSYGNTFFGRFQSATIPILEGWVGDGGCLNGTFRGANISYVALQEPDGDPANYYQFWQIAVNNLFGMRPSGYRVWLTPQTPGTNAPTLLVASGINANMPADYELPVYTPSLPTELTVFRDS